MELISTNSFTLNCKGRLVGLDSPKVMGILNLTPDSFYDGGKHSSIDKILKTVEEMLTNGVTFIDVGGYSSRPYANDVSVAEERNRVLPVIKAIINEFPKALLSIDTFRSEIAKAALGEGAALVNDISSGFLDPKMLNVVAEYGVPYIGMHLKGNPKTMQSETQYTDLITNIIYYFSERIDKANALGIKDFIIDPGFGFSKTTAQNFKLLNQLELLQNIDKPILVGISRKSMVYKTLNTTAEGALNGSTALHSLALFKGAHILRVHDVKEAIECVTLLNALKN